MYSKQERLEIAIGHLKKCLMARTQKEIAERMTASTATISKALKGDGTNLTNKFFRRFNRAFDNIFSEDWLISGRGEMLASEESENDQIVEFTKDEFLAELAAQRKLLSEAQAQINRLISIIEGMQRTSGENPNVTL